MKTKFFTIAFAILATVSTTLTSCDKNDDSKVITPEQKPATEQKVDNQNNNQNNNNQNTKVDEIASCLSKEMLQCFDFVATTNNGETYTIVAGADVQAKEIARVDIDNYQLAWGNAPLCKMKANSFNSTNDYTPVKVTAKVKEGAKLPTPFNFTILGAVERDGGFDNTKDNEYAFVKRLVTIMQNTKAGHEADVVNSQLKVNDFAIRKDGTLVFEKK